MRRFVPVLLVAALLLVAGCTTGPGASPTPTEEKTSSQLPSTTACPPPTTEAVTTRQNVSTEWVNSEGVEIHSGYPEPVTVALTRLSTNETTFVETYPPEEAASISLHDEMVDDLDYHVRVWTGCTLLWEGEVYAYEQIDVLISRNGSADASVVSEV